MTPKIQRKLWNIFKVLKQVGTTVDVLEEILAVVASGKKLTVGQAVTAINKLLVAYKAGVQISASDITLT
jgi:hypothetical protein